VEPGAPDICLTAPSCVKSIVGDDNCYRSTALIIIGSQSQHPAVCQAIVDHVRAIGDDLTGDSNTGNDDYIARNRTVVGPGPQNWKCMRWHVYSTSVSTTMRFHANSGHGWIQANWTELFPGVPV